MEVKFNVVKEERKSLVAAVSEITGVKAEYQGAPSFAFKINGHVVDKNGTMSFDERTDVADIRILLTELTERGFAFEGDLDEIAPAAGEPEAAASDEQASEDSGQDGDTPGDTDTVEPDEISAGKAYNDEESGMLVVEVPLTGFTRTAHDNLEKLVSGKADLIMKAIGVEESPFDDLPIKQTDSALRFPWFPLPLTNDAIDAYVKFVCALCEMAKKQKRVILKDRDADPDSSDKFAFRCFLLRLGFKGDEYKSARRVLLSKLSGNGSFKSGAHKRATSPEAATAADNGAAANSEEAAHA